MTVSTLKKLELDDKVSIILDDRTYTGIVVDHRNLGSKPDPVDPWYDPAVVSALIELEEDTIAEHELSVSTIQAYCAQFDGGIPAWKTPEAYLYHDDERVGELGEISDIVVHDD